MEINLKFELAFIYFKVILIFLVIVVITLFFMNHEKFLTNFIFYFELIHQT